MVEIVYDRLSTFETNANDTQKVAHKEQRKRDVKYLLYIHQCMDTNVFQKIIEEETIKGAWDKLKTLYGEDEKLKRVKLRTLKDDPNETRRVSCKILLTSGAANKLDEVV